MEDNKYYTPSVEEFYIGFEYEYKAKVPREFFPTKLETWHEYVCDGDFYLQEEIDSGNIRVKYLSKEDIESLGWKYISHGMFEICNNTANEIIEPKVIMYRLIAYTKGRFEIRPNHPSFNFGMYLGTIKNKSQFKVIMKQLGING